MRIDYLLKGACFTVLFGRGWQHLFWDVPYRSVLWDDSLARPIVEMLGFSWKNYVTSPYVDQIIQTISILVGCFLIFGAVQSVFMKKSSRFKGMLPVYSFVLGAIGLLYLKENFFRIPVLMEHALQIISPFALYLFLKGDKNRLFRYFIPLAIGVTFLGHGLFAIGLLHPVPGHFIDMWLSVFGGNEKSARYGLMIVGSIDVAVFIFMLVPVLRIYALPFAIGWGLLTALARVVSHFSGDLVLMSLHNWWFETVLRLPHFLFPLVLFIYLSKLKRIDLFKLNANFKAS